MCCCSVFASTPPQQQQQKTGKIFHKQPEIHIDEEEVDRGMALANRLALFALVNCICDLLPSLLLLSAMTRIFQYEKLNCCKLFFGAIEMENVSKMGYIACLAWLIVIFFHFISIRIFISIICVHWVPNLYFRFSIGKWVGVSHAKTKTIFFLHFLWPGYFDCEVVRVKRTPSVY